MLRGKGAPVDTPQMLLSDYDVVVLLEVNGNSLLTSYCDCLSSYL